MGWLLFALITGLGATPLEIEVWFLSQPASAFLDQLIKGPTLYGPYAQACEMVGDYCFDPAKGLYQPSDKQTKEDDLTVEADKGIPQLPTATSVDRTMVNCDAKYAFDIFCGKAVPEQAKGPGSKVEVWIDTSSSLRAIDRADAKGVCHRKELMEKLKASCAGVTIKGYDTSIREIGPESACQSTGLNDTKRLIEWMENSNAKKLVVITDVYEYQRELSDYLSSKNAKMRGATGVFPAKDMLNYVSDLAKSCE